MKVFERFRRRFAITMAGVLSATTLAAPIAPAIVAHAELPAKAGATQLKTFKDVRDNLQKDAIEVISEEEYCKSDTITGRKEGDTAPDKNDCTCFKFHAGVDGKITFSIFGDGKVYVDFWKADAEKPELEKELTLVKDVENKTDFGNIKLTAGDYYISFLNMDTKDIKIDISCLFVSKAATSKLVKVESPSKKTLKVTFKKVKGADGYEVICATDKYFEKNRVQKAFTNKKVKFEKKNGTVTIKKLKKGKKYYVGVRTYVVKDGKKYFSGWSEYTRKPIKVK